VEPLRLGPKRVRQAIFRAAEHAIGQHWPDCRTAGRSADLWWNVPDQLLIKTSHWRELTSPSELTVTPAKAGVSGSNSPREIPAFAGMMGWGRAPVGEAAVARAASRPGGRLGRFAAQNGLQRGCSPLSQMTNARAVSDPGACVTIARQPPCNFRPHASFKAELEAIPEPRPLTCVSRSKLLSGDWCLVIAKQRVAARLRRACVESATASPWLPVIAIRPRHPTFRGRIARPD